MTVAHTNDCMSVTLLGTGTSHGVPMIGCDCAVCTSTDPRDKRSRPAAAIRFDGRTILIDTPPELRLQCLTHGITRCDSVLFTHHHADHVAGLDDLRRFNWLQKSAIPCFTSPATIQHLRRMFAYAFADDPDYPSAKPQLELQPVEEPFSLFGRTVIPIPLMHGTLPVLGFRIGRFAYCTDVSHIPPSSFELLGGLEVLVLDALRIRPHPTHFTLEQAIEAACRIGARATYLTHIAHEIRHADTHLPAGMALGFDGLTVVL